MPNFKIKVLINYASRFNDDIDLNLLGVDNSITKLWGVLKPHCDVSVIGNETSTEVKNKINRYFEENQFLDDVFIFYYCGHGFLIKNMSELLLSEADTTKENYAAEVGITYQWLLQKIKKSKKNKYIIVLDCCYSGLAISNMGNPKKIVDFKENGAAIITATQNSCQTAKEIIINNNKYAAFTYCLAEEVSSLLNKLNNFTLGDLFSGIKTRICKFDSRLEVPMPQMICKDNFIDYVFQTNSQLYDIKNLNSFLSHQQN